MSEAEGEIESTLRAFFKDSYCDRTRGCCRCLAGGVPNFLREENCFKFYFINKYKHLTVCEMTSVVMGDSVKIQLSVSLIFHFQSHKLKL